MNTTQVNIPKSVAPNADKAKEYASALKQMMRRHGFRKTRFAVKITENNKLVMEMTDGSEAAKTFFGGFTEGLDTGMTISKALLAEQAKDIASLKREIAALKREVDEDKPSLQTKTAIDFSGLLSAARGEEDAPVSNDKRH